MSKVRCMDQLSTRNESKNHPLRATATSITSLSSQTVQIKRVDEDFETSPKLYSTKLCEGEIFDRQHGYRTPRLQPTLLQP